MDQNSVNTTPLGVPDITELCREEMAKSMMQQGFAKEPANDLATQLSIMATDLAVMMNSDMAGKPRELGIVARNAAEKDGDTCFQEQDNWIKSHKVNPAQTAILYPADAVNRVIGYLRRASLTNLQNESE